MIYLLKGFGKFVYWPIAWAIVWLPSMLMGDIGSVGGSLGLLLRGLGALIIIWALLIHTIAGRTLKQLGHSQGHKGIWPDRLVTAGIYSCMRHPQHLGLALIPLGMALLLASLIALVASGWGILAAFLFVLLIEEPECLRKFGPVYQEYMRKTLAFSLKPRCVITGLKELWKRQDR